MRALTYYLIRNPPSTSISVSVQEVVRVEVVVLISRRGFRIFSRRLKELRERLIRLFNSRRDCKMSRKRMSRMRMM